MSQAPSPAHNEGLSKFAYQPFACACTADGFESVSVHVEGELDRANVPEFQRALHGAQSETRTVSLDLEELAFIDCSGLKEVLDADLFARLTGRTLLLVRGSGQVDRVMALTGLLERLEVVESDGETPRPFAADPIRVRAS